MRARLRALISTEMWLQINVFHSQIRALRRSRHAAEQFSAVCAMLKEGVQAHTGITEGTFYRDQCWHFYMIGRYLERADQTTRLLDTRFHALVPAISVRCGDRRRRMECTAARRRRLSRLSPRAPARLRATEVAGFLLLHSAFPRSVGLNLAQMEWHLTQFRSRYHLRGCAAPLARLDHLRTMLASQPIEVILQRGLSPFLDWVQREVAALHDDITTHLCGG